MVQDANPLQRKKIILTPKFVRGFIMQRYLFTVTIRGATLPHPEISVSKDTKPSIAKISHSNVIIPDANMLHGRRTISKYIE